MEKLINLLRQPSTWLGTGTLGALFITFGIPIEYAQQIGATIIAFIGLYDIFRKEKING
jgi:hypothetical protein